MQETVYAYYVQLLSIGLLWVTVHCSGMCGPIIAGLTASQRVEAPTLWGRLRHSASGVLAYQGGRALTYMALGAGAGLAGSAAQEWIRGMTQAAGLMVAAILIVVGLVKLPFWKKSSGWGQISARLGQLSGRLVGRLIRFISRLAPRTGLLRMAVFGLVLGLLPCMLMFWALGLAASTASPLHGAALMALLVVMTTPVLVMAGCSTTVATGALRRAGAYLVPIAVLLSGIWLGLIAIAANGWIEHVHIPFELGGHRLVFMLW
jgi:uncharacterized protein